MWGINWRLEVSDVLLLPAPPKQIEDIKVKALHISCKKNEQTFSNNEWMLFYIFLIEACSKYGIIYLHLPIKINHM